MMYLSHTHTNQSYLKIDERHFCTNYTQRNGRITLHLCQHGYVGLPYTVQYGFMTHRLGTILSGQRRFEPRGRPIILPRSPHGTLDVMLY